MKHFKTRICLWLTPVFAMMLSAAMAFGQAAPSKQLTELEFITLLQSRMKQVDEARDLDDAAKAKAKDQYQQALGEMEAAKRWANEAAKYEKQAADAPGSLRTTKAKLALPPAPATADNLDGLTLPQIEQNISQRQADLEKQRKLLDDDETELKSRASRRAKIPAQVSEAKERLADINAQLQAAGAVDDNGLASFARKAVWIAKRRTAEQQIACCEKELAASDARSELLPASRDLNARKVAMKEQEIKQWQEIANQRRKHEAEQQAQQALWQAGQANPVVRSLAERNAALAEMRKSLAACIADTTAQLEQVNQKLATLKEQFTGVQQKVDTVGLTNIIGMLLRRQREQLPPLAAYRRNVALRQQTMGDGQLAGLQLDDERKPLYNLDAEVQGVLKGLSLAEKSDNRSDLEAAIRQVLSTKRDYLDALIQDSEAYYKKLVALCTAEQALIKETERCGAYIDERVLWIASTTPLKSTDARTAAEALWWLAGPKAWIDVGRALLADAARNPALTVLAIAVFVLLSYWRLRFRARIQQIGEKAARGSCYRFLPTLEAWAWTMLIAIGWPGLMWYVGWRLTAATDASELCKAVGGGLSVAARVFFVLELLRHTCCVRGLGEAHFGWPASALKHIRQNLRWLSLPVLPLVCVAVAMSAQQNDTWDSSLGRACFVAALSGFALFLQRILRPGGGVFQAVVAARHGGWLERLRYVWYPLGVVTPAALAILAAAGYYYTAQQLATRLIVTTYVLVGVIVIRAVLVRWILVSQRKLAIEEARQRRAAAAESNTGEDAATAELPGATDERDLATINTQTRRLVEYAMAVACALALWFAWIDVLPALGNVNRDLWPTKITVRHKEPQPNNRPDVWKSEEVDGFVTLADLCLAVIVLATTVIAAKNIPGLMEMAVLRHLPLDAGARYAVATVCRYVITIVGVLLCCASLGVGWSKVQWLVAAMSLGLGFGLQEIFANFVSGLIILIERPVRVGDVVTIDGVTGVVSRIRMSATTITDGDRKELIIPNKEFITGQVLNWTLTDQVNRVVIRVNIAYGSDTQQAAEILRRIASAHPSVLDDPSPGVSLESFGESALNFVLRCFLPNMDSRGTVIHDLHMAIDREFRTAGIEIAYPQQDVHVRSIDLPPPILQPTIGAASTPWAPQTSVERAA